MNSLPGKPLAPAQTAAPRYEDLYPYHAELCALSELRKKPGSSVPLRSGIGGHSLLYLNGVRLDRTAHYPFLRLCTADEPPADHGVGISVNSHYGNANWVGVEGRDFLRRGALAPGARLTREAYEHTQALAKAAGFLDGVEFHKSLFQAKPPGMSARDYMYEISVATDYAAQFGRNIYSARLPLDRARMARIVDYLNNLNAPYREGRRLYHWRVLNNNCSHVAHNALAAAGVWAPWPTGQFFAFAAFNFPVPKNELVDLITRTNDLPIENPQALFDDLPARTSLLENFTLPTAPGALASAASAIMANDIYDVARLRLIFFDNPFWGPYRFRFRRIFATPRYYDLPTNLRHFAARYAVACADNAAWAPRSAAQKTFQRQHAEYIQNATQQLRPHLAQFGDSP